MKKTTRIFMSIILTLIIAFIAFYITLPAISIYSTEFWGFLTFVVIAFGVANFLLSLKGTKLRIAKNNHVNVDIKKSKFAKCIIIAAAIPIVIILVGGIVSSAFFNAYSYADIIDVKDAVFEEDMPESDTVKNIALMDSQSATIIGNRTLGALSDVVSQYEIKANGTANIEWYILNNNQSGNTGYFEISEIILTNN